MSMEKCRNPNLTTISLPKIKRRSSPSNEHKQLNHSLSSARMGDLKKIYLQYKSNARILEGSPYYRNTEHKTIACLLKEQRYSLSQADETVLKAQFTEGIYWDGNPDQTAVPVQIRFLGKIRNFKLKAKNSEQLKALLLFQLAKIQLLANNTANNAKSIIGFRTLSQDAETDFSLSYSHYPLFQTDYQLEACYLSGVTGSQIQLAHFELIKCLGTGGFSFVYLARSRLDNRYYALKFVNKDCLRQENSEAVSNERFILREMRDCPFVTALEFAFETLHHCVFGIQYCPGGELFNRLKSVKRMSESEAKFYFLEILVGLDAIHKKNIVYRDLKPENLLLAADGHIKIADFGLSRTVNSNKEKCFSFCGSPQYMAPEMLTRSGHNYLLDYYCLGALLYELVVGIPPYYSQNHDDIYDGILNKELIFPSHVELSHELKNMLRGLLQKNQERRLGSLLGLKEVLYHPWVGKIKVDTILNKELQPPHIPDLQQFNFDTGDIKDQSSILPKLESDIRAVGFQPVLDNKFTFQNESTTKALAKLKDQRSKKSPNLKQLLCETTRNPVTQTSKVTRRPLQLLRHNQLD